MPVVRAVDTSAIKCGVRVFFKREVSLVHIVETPHF
jgi:hypothetical protein